MESAICARQVISEKLENLSLKRNLFKHLYRFKPRLS